MEEDEFSAKYARNQTADSSVGDDLREASGQSDERMQEAHSGPTMELSINVTSDGVMTDSQLDTEDKLEQSMEAWIPPGKDIAVNSYEISDGMIYVGSELSAVKYRGTDGCLINPDFEVDTSRLDPSGSRMSYWPSYSNIDPGCRATYLEWLADGRRDPDIDIGYVFLFFYDIERRILFDAQHSSEARSEIPTLLKEVEELLEVYGEDSSFSGYATRFLNAARARYDPDSLTSVTETTRRRELPLGLRVKIGRQIANGEPVDPELAYDWLLQAPDTSLRTPAKRCEDKFKDLFLLRYEERFDGGLTKKANKTPLKVSYSPASSCLPQQEEVEIEGVPDISALSAPTRKFQEIANECCEELDSYSRYVGKTQDRDSLEALSLLPKPVLNQRETDRLNEFREAIEDELGESEMVETTLNLFFEHWSIKKGEDIEKRDLRRLANLLEKLGFGIEPDVRFSAPSRGWREPAVLYRLPPDTSAEDSAISEGIRLIQKLAVKIVLANDEVAPEQTEYLAENLGRFLKLSEVDQVRLNAHRRWLILDSPTLHGVRQRAEDLPEDQKPQIANFLTALACSDGDIDTNEIQELSKIYPMLGLNEDLVHTHLHQLQTETNRDDDEPVTIRKPESTTEGYEIPEVESDEESSTAEIELDQGRVDRTLEESQEVSEFLSDIFEDEENDKEQREKEGDRSEAQKADSTSDSTQTVAAGLDEDHQQFLTTLSQKEHWSREEIEEVAQEQGLFPDAAIDVINDHAFESLETQLIEGKDTIMVKQELANEILE
ncbi:MAG: TerB N-terminal domain-containing protein [Halobacteriales archaeon]|nr:TerB N-terminal domain-containing protein [Halobacteriales archaeon]